MRVLLAVLPLVATTGLAHAQACDPAAFATPYAETFLAGDTFVPAAAPETMDEGACQQDALVATLTERLGPVVGYKAAATSPAAQQQLGLSEPILGVLTRDMLLADGATVAIADGGRMIFELDLLARVGPDGVAGATDQIGALAAIDAFIPFVELGDLMLPEGTPLSGPLLQAMNAGARLGVMGEPQPRGDMTPEDAEVIAGRLMLNGEVVAEAQATALLGHPLDAVLWILRAADARGIEIKPGDVLSLGGMGRLQPAVPGEVSARYSGFGLEEVTVGVTLE